MPPPMIAAHAPRHTPNMRVEIRDARWRIQHADARHNDGHVLDRESLFLKRLGQLRISATIHPLQPGVQVIAAFTGPPCKEPA